MKSKKPLTILFDANPMVAPSKSGVGYFTTRLIAALAAEYPNDLKLVGHYYNFLGRKRTTGLVQAGNVTYRQTKVLPGKVFNGLRRKLHIQIPLEVLARCKADVLLFPNFAILPSLFHKPRVVVVHDLYFTEHPEHINRNNIDFLQKFVPPSLASADLIITMSDFTKQAIVKKFQTPAAKILTISIPPAEPTIISHDMLLGTLQDLGIRKEYILFIGNIEPRKNLIPLVAAYTKLSRKLRDTYSLVLAGGKGWSDDAIVNSISDAQAAGFDIITPGYVSDTQKAALYQGATVLALPSHYEGFGMQILEAMSYGIPTAVSDIPVFHEVAQDAARYFDQNDPDSIAACLEELLQSDKLCAALIKKAKNELKRYRWNEVAKNVYARIEEVVHG